MGILTIKGGVPGPEQLTLSLHLVRGLEEGIPICWSVLSELAYPKS